MEGSIIEEQVDGFIKHMGVLNRSASTIETLKFKLGKFTEWCRMRAHQDPRELTLKNFQSFQGHLHRHKKSNGEKMIIQTQHAILSSVKNFFQWLRRQGYVAEDHTENLELPKLPPKSLPNKGLTDEEVAKLFRSQDVNTTLGLRNRCILAVFYATGIRREELTKIDIQHVDLRNQTIVIDGKGGKPRIVVLGDAACGWITKYLSESRPSLDLGEGGNALFLNKNGKRMNPKGMSHTMKRIFNNAGVEVAGSNHLWRHTFCSKMVTNGCNLVYAQELMGHASLEYISRYTSYNMDDLKEAHKQCHPDA